MSLPLLQVAAISADLGTMPFEHLIAILSFFLVVITVIFLNGFSVKFGGKEVNIGGIRKLLVKKDEDTLLKEGLKRFSDDVDHDIEADLYDLIDDIDSEIQRLALSKHCYFTFEKLSSIVKRELEKRIRRNNLKEKLSESSKNKYVSAILRDVEDRYDVLRAKISLLNCGESYAEFKAVEDGFREVLDQFFDRARGILVSGMENKIEKYEQTKDQFKTATARKFCCDDRILKNKMYIKNLTGTEGNDETGNKKI
jgi:hypothetical protein